MLQNRDRSLFGEKEFEQLFKDDGDDFRLLFNDHHLDSDDSFDAY